LELDTGNSGAIIHYVEKNNGTLLLIGKHEQEAIVMYNVCKGELTYRGCLVEEFGDFHV